MSSLSNQPHNFIGCGCGFDEADVVLFGAPFDSTTSFRPGARFAPPAIRGDSFGIETYSPYLDKDLTDCHVMDSGDLELPFGDVTAALRLIEARTDLIAQSGKVPVMLGGEHLVTLGVIRALARLHPDLQLIHFDAHADLRDDYLGQGLSHATVMRRVYDLLDDGRISQFGIRSGEQMEFAFAKAHTNMQRLNFDGLAETVARLRDKPVYFTLDMDVLDPSVFPGTGTPEPGGVSFEALLAAVHALKGLKIVGCDVVELSPHYDHSGISTAAACKILREILLILGGA